MRENPRERRKMQERERKSYRKESSERVNKSAKEKKQISEGDLRDCVVSIEEVGAGLYRVEVELELGSH